MVLKTTSEMWWELEALKEFYYDFVDKQLNSKIANKEYGDDILKVLVILICREAGSEFKIRKRYYNDEKWIGIDCILDFKKTMSLFKHEQKIYLLEELKKTFTSLQSYKKKLKNFDFETFENDIQQIIEGEIKRIQLSNLTL